MIIDLDIFEKKGNKQDKIRMLEILGFDIDDTMRQKIMYEDMILNAYKCSEGVWTIGIGCTSYQDGKRVRQGDKISIYEAVNLYRYHLGKVVNGLKHIFSDAELRQIGESRRSVLIDLIFNMGLSGVKGFPSMIQALKEGDWEKASDELKYTDGKSILSNYYKQVGQRAKDNVRKLKEG